MKMDKKDNDFKCRCCVPNLIDPRVPHLHREIEKDVGEELNVSSGYRCEKHNKAVGGSDTSSHMKGLAWDIECTRSAWDIECTRSRLRFRIIQSAIKHGITRIGIEKDYIHLDIDRQKAPRVIWLY